MINEKLTTDKIIAAIHDTRGMLTLTARRLGVSVNTVRRYVKLYQSVREALEEERDCTTDIAELKLFEAIQRGEKWAVIFYLKMQGHTRGYTEHQVIDQNGAQEIIVTYASDNTDTP
jgi:hypothetical protein